MKSFLIICISIFLSGKLYSQPFKLDGEVENKKDGWIYYSYIDPQEKIVFDSTKIIDNKFSINGTINSISYLKLINDKKYPLLDETYIMFILIEPGEQSIKYKYGDLKNATFLNSDIQREKAAYDSTNIRFLNKRNILSLKIDSLKEALLGSSQNHAEIENQIASLRDKNQSLFSHIQFNDIQYIRKHPNSYLSAYLLDRHKNHLEKDSLIALYRHLSAAVKTSSLTQRLYTNILKDKSDIEKDFPYSKIELFKEAPAFFYIDNDAKQKTNKDYLGKVYLIEFWDLYCIPCLPANRELEQIRRKFSDKGFEIISVTTTGEYLLNKFNQYIENNGLKNWKHVFSYSKTPSSDKTILAADFSKFETYAIPTTYIIDRQGKVIYKSIGYDKEKEPVLEKLISDTINK